MASYFHNRVDAVVAPDKGALQMAQNAASILKCKSDYFEKTRISADEVRMRVKNMDVAGKRLLIVDDIISTGGTMCKAVEILKNQDATDIYVACIHGLFVKDADKKIFQAGAKELIATDTIETSYSKVTLAKDVAKLLR